MWLTPWAVRSSPVRCGVLHLKAAWMPKSMTFYKTVMVEGFVKWRAATLTRLLLPRLECHCECVSSVISLKLCGGYGVAVWEQGWITEALSRQDSALLYIHIPADFSQLSSWVSAPCLSQKLSVTVLQRLCLLWGFVFGSQPHGGYSLLRHTWLASFCTQWSHNMQHKLLKPVDVDMYVWPSLN